MLTTLLISCFRMRSFEASLVSFSHMLLPNIGCLISMLKSMSYTIVTPFRLLTKSNFTLSDLLIQFYRYSIILKNFTTGKTSFLLTKEAFFLILIVSYSISSVSTGKGTGNIWIIYEYFFIDSMKKLLFSSREKFVYSNRSSSRMHSYFLFTLYIYFIFYRRSALSRLKLAMTLGTPSVTK